MDLQFTKMQATGNDYIYMDSFDHEIDLPQSLAPVLSDRHFGIGGDGLVLIGASDIAHGKMRMFNADGTEGKMCGNAIRCVGKYLYEKRDIHKQNLTIETLSGVKSLYLDVAGGKVSSVTVNMGKAEFSSVKIPIITDKVIVIDTPFTIGDKVYNITGVSMGNPHSVVFCKDIEHLDLPKIGAAFNESELFPEGVNVEFVHVVNSNTLAMRVWERGSGETLACGTGACAAVAAAVLNGYCPKDTPIKVLLKGGELTIRYTDEAVFMTGDCVTVFEGNISL